MDLVCGQNSVWVSPYAHNFLDDPEQHLDAPVAQRLELFKGLRTSPGEESTIAQRVWDIEALNDEYQIVYTQWQERFTDAGETDLAALRETAASLHNTYLDLLCTDPCLPRQLLPDDWYRDRVADLAWQWRSFFALPS